MNESWISIQTEVRKSVTCAGVVQSDKSLLRVAGLFRISPRRKWEQRKAEWAVWRFASCSK